MRSRDASRVSAGLIDSARAWIRTKATQHLDSAPRIVLRLLIGEHEALSREQRPRNIRIARENSYEMRNLIYSRLAIMAPP